MTAQQSKVVLMPFGEFRSVVKEQLLLAQDGVQRQRNDLGADVSRHPNEAVAATLRFWGQRAVVMKESCQTLRLICSVGKAGDLAFVHINKSVRANLEGEIIPFDVGFLEIGLADGTEQVVGVLGHEFGQIVSARHAEFMQWAARKRGQHGTVRMVIRWGVGTGL